MGRRHHGVDHPQQPATFVGRHTSLLLPPQRMPARVSTPPCFSIFTHRTASDSIYPSSTLQAICLHTLRYYARPPPPAPPTHPPTTTHHTHTLSASTHPAHPLPVSTTFTRLVSAHSFAGRSSSQILRTEMSRPRDASTSKPGMPQALEELKAERQVSSRRRVGGEGRVGRTQQPTASKAATSEQRAASSTAPRCRTSLHPTLHRHYTPLHLASPHRS